MLLDREDNLTRHKFSLSPQCGEVPNFDPRQPLHAQPHRPRFHHLARRSRRPHLLPLPVRGPHRLFDEAIQRSVEPRARQVRLAFTFA